MSEPRVEVSPFGGADRRLRNDQLVESPAQPGESAGQCPVDDQVAHPEAATPFPRYASFEMSIAGQRVVSWPCPV